VWPVFVVRRCYACPRHDNISSVRAFMKAGFRPLRPIDVADGERELLMQRERQS
jgi:RimJ/RimL family protein N-acetyltransferase